MPAMARWPGVIQPGQLVGDIIHETDLFTTYFARLGGATENTPTDRIIDGIDQTALFLKDDTFSRRDYVFIYTGNILAATVKGRYKRAWVGEKPGLSGPLSSTSTPTREKKTPRWSRCSRPRECSTSLSSATNSGWRSIRIRGGPRFSAHRHRERAPGNQGRRSAARGSLETPVRSARHH